MYETLPLNDIQHIVRDRIADLHTTARELQLGRRDTGHRTSLVLRTRSTLGRRLVSMGHMVTGQQV